MPYSSLFDATSAQTDREDFTHDNDDVAMMMLPSHFHAAMPLLPLPPVEYASPDYPAEWFRDDRLAVLDGPLRENVQHMPPFDEPLSSSSMLPHPEVAHFNPSDPVDAIFYGDDSVKYLNQRMADAEAREEAQFPFGDDGSEAHDLLTEDAFDPQFCSDSVGMEQSVIGGEHFGPTTTTTTTTTDSVAVEQDAPRSDAESDPVIGDNGSTPTESSGLERSCDPVPVSDYDRIGYCSDDGGAASDGEYDCATRAAEVSKFFAACRMGPRCAVPQLMPAAVAAAAAPPLRSSRRIRQRHADEIARLPQQTPLSRLYDSVARPIAAAGGGGGGGGTTVPIGTPSAWTHGGPLPVRPKRRRRVRAALRRQWGSAHLADGFEYCFESRFADAETRDAMARLMRRAGFADVDRPVTSGCAKLDHLLRRRAFPDLGVGVHDEMGLSVVNRGPDTIRSGDWVGEYVGTIMGVGEFVQLCRRAREMLGLATPFAYGYALRTPNDRHVGRRANHANARRSRRPDADPYTSHVVTPLAGPMNIFLFLNGSCHPNVEYVEQSVGGAMRVFMRATRDIPVGGHLRADYGEALPVLPPRFEGAIYEDEDPDKLVCRCGARCRNRRAGRRQLVDIYGSVLPKRRRRRQRADGG